MSQKARCHTHRKRERERARACARERETRKTRERETRKARTQSHGVTREQETHRLSLSRTHGLGLRLGPWLASGLARSLNKLLRSPRASPSLSRLKRFLTKGVSERTGTSEFALMSCVPCSATCPCSYSCVGLIDGNHPPRSYISKRIPTE